MREQQSEGRHVSPTLRSLATEMGQDACDIFADVRKHVLVTGRIDRYELHEQLPEAARKWEQRKLLHRALRVLRLAESPWERGVCPSCQRDIQYGGPANHAPDCELAELLK
jgi:hypothetical protein